MSAKDTVVGTAKQIVAEIVGDGRLAEEGSRQAGGNRPLSAPDADVDGLPQNRSRLPDAPSFQASQLTEEDRFASLLGHAALKFGRICRGTRRNGCSLRRWTTASSRTPSRCSCTIVIRKPRTRRGPR